MMEATLSQILESREDRARKQQALLKTYKKPLLCFTMNIPGPVKLDRDVSIGFYVGCRLLRDALRGHKVLYAEETRLITGCEAYFVVDMSAIELKRLAIDIENTQMIGRLFDMDVLEPESRKLSREELGFSRRKCLLCDNDAAICAGRRIHTLAQLQDRVGFLLYVAAREYLCEYIAVQAYLSLHQEVSTTPKPGLVDRDNTGAHKDMDIRHFFASENALRPFFYRFAEAGFLSRDDAPTETFQKIRTIGREAEETMLKATHGVNTHKGAIFSLGILCAAAGRLDPSDWRPKKLLQECAAMTKGLVQQDFSHITLDNAATSGEKLYAQYGITGARGQAEAGFPAVHHVGLPTLKEGLSRGLSLNDAGAATLLHLICAADDTNLIKRSSRESQLQLQKTIADLLKHDPFPSLETLKALDQDFTEQNLSPGGSADLLAATYFLWFLCA